MATNSTNEFERILVARGGAIGDFVLTLPVFQALRSRFPNAFVEVLGYPHIASIAAIDGHVDRISRIESLAFTPLFTPSLEIPQPTRDYFSSFDLIVSYIHDPDRHFQRRVSELSSARFLAGPGRSNQTSTSHASEALLRPLQEIGVFTTDNEPRLLRKQTTAGSHSQARRSDGGVSSDPIEASAQADANMTIACHPGSGNPAKNWPLEKWGEFLLWLIEESPARPVIVGGEADRSQLEKLKALLPQGHYDLWENLPLPQLARRLSQCAAFVGHDSGITHLAAAVGIHTTAIWGSTTNPDVWRPVGPRVKLIFAEEGLENLAVDAVSVEVGRLFD